MTVKSLIRKTVDRVKKRLVEIYTKEGSRTKEEIASYTAKVTDELDKKSLNEIINEYKDIVRFQQQTIDRAN